MDYGLGASYNFGLAKLAGLVRQQRNKLITGESVRFDTAHVGAIVPLGVGAARVGYYDNASTEDKAHQLSLGYVYNLSKRTALYGTYAFMKNQK